MKSGGSAHRDDGGALDFLQILVLEKKLSQKIQGWNGEDFRWKAEAQ